MKLMTLMSAMFIAGSAIVTGCTPQAAAPPSKETAAKTEKPEAGKKAKHEHDHDEEDDKHAATDKKAEKKGADHDHSGWWCDEHGVPEKQCSQCSAKVAAEFQKKGDWCAEHDRAKSQCFICDPKLKETFASQYRAKEGKEPPPLEEKDEKDEKKDEKKS